MEAEQDMEALEALAKAKEQLRFIFTHVTGFFHHMDGRAIMIYKGEDGQKKVRDGKSFEECLEKAMEKI